MVYSLLQCHCPTVNKVHDSKGIKGSLEVYFKSRMQRTLPTFNKLPVEAHYINIRLDLIL